MAVILLNFLTAEELSAPNVPLLLNEILNLVCAVTENLPESEKLSVVPGILESHMPNIKKHESVAKSAVEELTNIYEGRSLAELSDRMVHRLLPTWSTSSTLLVGLYIYTVQSCY
jgi:hypothetical protein